MLSRFKALQLVLLVTLWYLSSAMTNTIAKMLFQYFKYPVTVSYLQFFFVAFYSILYSAISHGLGAVYTTNSTTISNNNNKTTLTSHPFNAPYSNTTSTAILQSPSRELIVKIFPLSLFLISGHVFSSYAISTCSISFVHTIKALSPLFTVIIYGLYYKHSYSNQTYLSLIPLTCGVMLACAFDLSFDTSGLIFSLMSTLIFVLQNIFSKFLFQDRSLNKLSMLLYSSSMAFLLMTPFWYLSEGHRLMFSMPSNFTLTDKPSHSTTLTIFYLFLNGSSHFLQNVLAFIILSMISPVSYSIASLLKRIVVIVVSIIWFSQTVLMTQVFGICLTFIGLYLYNFARPTGTSNSLPTKKVSPPPSARPPNYNNIRSSVANKGGIEEFTNITTSVFEKIKNFDLVRESSEQSIYQNDDEEVVIVVK